MSHLSLERMKFIMSSSHMVFLHERMLVYVMNWLYLLYGVNWYFAISFYHKKKWLW